MNNPIEIAVAPIKVDAIARAEKEVAALIERMIAQLEEGGWDLNIVAPYPNSMKESRESYQRKVSRHKLFTTLFKSVASSRSMRDPHLVARDAEREASFLNVAKIDAGLQYDAFVSKLVAKIGDCDAATISGNHVWGYSILSVTKGDVVERWKTQQIVNVSKLGKLFNQWPTRKQKAK